MIERIVMFKLNEEHSHDAGRRAVVEQTRELFPQIPQVVSVSVGLPANEASLSSWDFSIVVRFRSLEDMEAYRVHPIHQAYLDEVRPKTAVVKAWAMEIPD